MCPVIAFLLRLVSHLNGEVLRQRCTCSMFSQCVDTFFFLDSPQISTCFFFPNYLLIIWEMFKENWTEPWALSSWLNYLLIMTYIGWLEVWRLLTYSWIRLYETQSCTSFQATTVAFAFEREGITNVTMSLLPRSLPIPYVILILFIKRYNGLF